LNRIITFSFLALSASLLLSCKNTEAELFAFDVNLEETSSIIDKDNGTIEVTFPDHIRTANKLSTDFIISEGADAYVNNSLQISGVSENNYEAPFNFTIISEDELLETSWHVRSVNNDYTETWGMGGFLHKELSHDKPYEWYIDQSQTGYFSDYNCAPSCVIMASYWQDSDCSYTVEDARHKYHPSGGGWYTFDIEDCLNEFNTEHQIISLSDFRSETLQILLDYLDDGNIILLAIDVHYLEDSFDPEIRINKYYETIQLGTGHCILIKGYKEVDGISYFEVYDPIGYEFKYTDGSFKGKDRYYLSDDVYTAAFASWNFAFVILGPKSKKSSERSVNIDEIPNILVL
jgi:hypothetical protein